MLTLVVSFASCFALKRLPSSWFGENTLLCIKVIALILGRLSDSFKSGGNYADFIEASEGFLLELR